MVIKLWRTSALLAAAESDVRAARWGSESLRLKKAQLPPQATSRRGMREAQRRSAGCGTRGDLFACVRAWIITLVAWTTTVLCTSRCVRLRACVRACARACVCVCARARTWVGGWVRARVHVCVFISAGRAGRHETPRRPPGPAASRRLSATAT